MRSHNSSILHGVNNACQSSEIDVNLVPDTIKIKLSKKESSPAQSPHQMSFTANGPFRQTGKEQKSGNMETEPFDGESQNQLNPSKQISRGSPSPTMEISYAKTESLGFGTSDRAASK